jgi:hypothetical protein
MTAQERRLFLHHLGRNLVVVVQVIAFIVGFLVLILGASLVGYVVQEHFGLTPFAGLMIYLLLIAVGATIVGVVINAYGKMRCEMASSRRRIR